MGPVKAGKLQRIPNHHSLKITKVATRIQESAGHPVALLLKFAHAKGRVFSTDRAEYSRPATRHTDPASRITLPLHTGHATPAAHTTHTTSTCRRKAQRLPIKSLKRNRLIIRCQMP